MIENKVPEEKLFHTLSVEETLKELQASENGLSEEAVRERSSRYGPNKLQESKKRTIFQMFLDQFKNVMIIILLIAAVISGLLKEITDAVIILVVVVLNAFLGVFQENKAEKALEALKNMSSPYSKVKRAGEVKQIKSEEIVPGDIVLLEAGDYVPADLRLIESANLKIEEAALTGESVPVEKTTVPINERDIMIGDRRNSAYLGSSVTYGRGTGVVIKTAMKTEVGKIAEYITEEHADQTPLQIKLAEMGKYLSIAVIIVAIFIFIAGIMQGRDYFEMFLTAVSLAVAAIPEGLPAIVTIVLALGVQKMAKKNAIIRKLPAVETLGNTEIICSDKTGTLTQNKMTVKQIFLNGTVFTENEADKQLEDLSQLINIIALCNDSKINNSLEGQRETIGDPTETALINFAIDKGFSKEKLDLDNPRQGEIPFASDRKLMTTINVINNTNTALTKGAVDVLLDRCTQILKNGQIHSLTEEDTEQILNANKQMARKALRILAAAYKPLDQVLENPSPDQVEKDLIFVGLVGMIDPPREEAKQAIAKCSEAGIRPVMITGDHKETATAIARELRIITDEKEVLTGNELDKINADDFNKAVSDYSVYARVSPEHKVRIVKTWKKKNKIVAMTGDGVNDAPALKTADIGIGMGITGTDVAKGVSDMVLSDDNFATIVAAVEEGRKIFSNIRKTIQFLLSANTAEILTLLIATLLNWKILFPIHILWINLVTDAFPALALGMEKAEKDIMKQKARESNKSFLAGGVGYSILYQGAFQAAITLGVYYLALNRYDGDPGAAITMAFATLGLLQLSHVFNVRSLKKSLFKIGFFTNRYLIAAVVFSVLLQVSVILIPYLNDVFKVVALNMEQWLIVIIASLAIIPIVEIIKALQRIYTKK